jgi:conjugative transposon TraM protein
MKEHSEKFLRKRKSLLVLPVLIVPFLTMTFWALGGGKEKKTTVVDAKAGLNTKLPDPKLRADKELNKMSFYELAQKDSQKLKAAFEKDRKDLQFDGDSNKYSLHQLKSLTDRYAHQYHQEGLTNDDPLQNSSGAVSRSKAAEENLLKKLNKLETEMNRPSATADRYPGNERRLKPYAQRNEPNPDMDRLEKMLHVMKSGEGDNAEIKQLDTVLEKILDLQYPERVKEKIKEKSKQDKRPVSVVQQKQQQDNISVLGAGAESVTGSSFYGIGNAMKGNEVSQNAIEAVVHKNQTIVSGAVVELRLQNDIMVNGVVIPKDNAVSGIAKLSAERLTVEITSITYNNSVFPVSLEVYDLDGLAGIYIPGAITRDVAKQSANSSVQSMGMTTLDPSLAAQATTAGINAAKDLFSRKVKLVRVTVKAGYKVLLQINHQ